MTHLRPHRHGRPRWPHSRTPPPSEAVRTARGDRIRREQKKADECGHMKQNEAARARLSAAAVAASMWCDGERNIIYICVIDGTEWTRGNKSFLLRDASVSPLFTQVRQNSMRLVVAIIFSRARLLMVISLLELYTVVPPFTFLRGYIYNLPHVSDGANGAGFVPSGHSRSREIAQLARQRRLQTRCPCFRSARCIRV